MRLSLDANDNIYLIQGYGDGYVTFSNGQTCRQSLIVTAGQLVDNWPPQQFDQLAAEHFQAIRELDPELVIFGTGAKQQFPHPRLTRPLIEAGIGVEVMDTAAACRTYNIVVAEDRRVAAGLLMI